MRLARSRGKRAAAPDAAGGMVPAPRSRPESELLGEILVRHGSLSRSQLEDALTKLPGAGMQLGALLVQLRYVDPRALAAAVAEQLDLRTVDLRRVEPDM